MKKINFWYRKYIIISFVNILKTIQTSELGLIVLHKEIIQIVICLKHFYNHIDNISAGVI